MSHKGQNLLKRFGRNDSRWAQGSARMSSYIQELCHANQYKITQKGTFQKSPLSMYQSQTSIYNKDMSSSTALSAFLAQLRLVH